MANLVYEAVAVIGETKDGKKIYKQVGTVWKTERGISLKLDMIPTTGWNGWIGFYEPKKKEAEAKPEVNAEAKDAGADIPF